MIEDKKFDEFNIRLVITIIRNLLTSTFIRHSHRDPELIAKI
jgi:hypothetical protein